MVCSLKAILRGSQSELQDAHSNCSGESVACDFFFLHVIIALCFELSSCEFCYEDITRLVTLMKVKKTARSGTVHVDLHKLQRQIYTSLPFYARLKNTSLRPCQPPFCWLETWNCLGKIEWYIHRALWNLQWAEHASFSCPIVLSNWAAEACHFYWLTSDVNYIFQLFHCGQHNGGKNPSRACSNVLDTDWSIYLKRPLERFLRNFFKKNFLVSI